MTSGTKPLDRRVPGIDFLRGLCIIAVVVHHISLRIPMLSVVGPAANKVFFFSGYWGVRVFFVISGFLITTWSLRRWKSLQSISVKQFYLMRFARIVPCLVGLLALLAVLDLAGVPRFTINPQHTSLGRALFAALTFHINWLEAQTGYLPAAWDVLWSLSVEEVFYIVFPLLCVLFKKQSVLVLLLFGFVVAGPFARVLTTNELWIDYGYLNCMDGIALGCLAAIIAANVRLTNKANLALQTTGIGLAVFIDVFRGTAARIGFYKLGLDVTILQIGIALIVIALQHRFDQNDTNEHRSKDSAAAVLSGVVRWFGRNSYEVYLTHVLLIFPMVALFQYLRLPLPIAFGWFAIYAVLAGILGDLVARFYSEPLNQTLRVRFKPVTARAVVLQPSTTQS